MKQKIFNFATQTLGFDDCRFTDPHLKGGLNGYKEWLGESLHGDMKYLEDHLKFKENPDLLLEGVQTAIVVIKNYKNTEEKSLNGSYKIARYAVGRDYHLVIKEKLDELTQFIKSQNKNIECYSGVDSRPIAERELAIKAGVGFLGKNGMVIKPGLGSYFFIGVILSTAKITEDPKLKWDCGDCRLCLDACPTQALLGDGSMDATKCISYMTIEQKEELSTQQIGQTEGWLFGCDICQEVCPYNNENTPLTNWDDFAPHSGVGFRYFEDFDPKTPPNIPKETPLYRSRKRLLPNLKNSHQIYHNI